MKFIAMLFVFLLSGTLWAADGNLLPERLHGSGGTFANGLYRAVSNGKTAVFSGDAVLEQKMPGPVTFAVEYRTSGVAEMLTAQQFQMYVNLVYMDGTKAYGLGRTGLDPANEFTRLAFTLTPAKPVRTARFHLKYSGPGTLEFRHPELAVTPQIKPAQIKPPEKKKKGGLHFENTIPLHGPRGNGVYAFSVPEDGEYHLIMRTESKRLDWWVRAKLQVDDTRPHTRVVYSFIRSKLWDPMLRMDLKAGKHTLKITEFPEDVELVKLQVFHVSQLPDARMPQVPEAAQHYIPKAVPRPDHPRVIVNREIITRLRKDHDRGELREEWQKLEKMAKGDLAPKRVDGVPVYHWLFLRRVESAAFYAMVMRDPVLGKKAADAIFDYFSNIDFDNLVLTSRDIGESIFTTACVYDWCYEYLSKDQRDLLYKKMLYYARMTEPRWPPFRQTTVIKGHGNESVMMRDLPAMAIAVYNEDPTPWKYIAYRYFEELAPGHKFEFRSGRHSQGANYGPCRFAMDLWANILVKSATGKELLDPNYRQVPYFFMHLFQPSLEYFDLNDIWSPRGRIYKDRQMMTAAAANLPQDPFIKSEMQRLDALRPHPRSTPEILTLSFSDPSVTPQPITELPLAAMYRDPLSSFAMRTAWAPDAAASFWVGVPYRVGDHCHMDSGTWQIFHYDRLFTDIGNISWGVPYDMLYGRRTVSHTGGVLIHDPDEVNLFNGRNYIDGGQQLKMGAGPQIADVFRHPELTFTGKTLVQQAFPDTKAPKFCYMKLDLREAYTAKVKAFERELLWLPTGDRANPAWLLTYDRIEAAKPEFSKAYLLCTYLKPEISGNTVTARKGKGTAQAAMLLPEKIRITTFGNGEALRVRGKMIDYKGYEGKELGKAWRTEIAPAIPAAKDEFLCAVHIGPETVKPVLEKSGSRRNVRCGAFLVSFAVRPDTGCVLNLTAPAKVLVTGLQPGKYICGKHRFTVDRNGTWYAEIEAGKYTIRLAGGRK